MARLLPGLLALSLAASPAGVHAEQADLCQELAAFVDKAAPASQAPASPQAPAPAAAAQSPTQPLAGGPTAVEAPRPATGEPKPGGSDPSQQTSSLSGPVREEGVGAAGPQGQAQMTAPSGGANPPPSPPQATARGEPAKPASAPAPQTATTASTAKTPVLSSQLAKQARTAISAKDAGACRAAAQQMRRAGLAMPPPLLALAALPQQK